MFCSLAVKDAAGGYPEDKRFIYYSDTHIRFMQFRQVLIRSFQLLRSEPRLFYPRIVMTLVWSAFWIYLAQLFVPMLQSPADYVLNQQITLDQIVVLSVFVFIMTPAELWMYNAYFFMVKQRHVAGDIDMGDAFYRGLLRLPQSIVLFCLLGTMALIFGTPGAIMFMYGQVHNVFWFQATGVLLSIMAITSVMLTVYFTPISVVLGERSFWRNVKEGLIASDDERHGVYLITLFSFAILLLASVTRGSLQQIGIAGFLLGRLLASIESVYLLIVNPELFIQIEKNREDSTITEQDALEEPDGDNGTGSATVEPEEHEKDKEKEE